MVVVVLVSEHICVNEGPGRVQSGDQTIVGGRCETQFFYPRFTGARVIEYRFNAGPPLYMSSFWKMNLHVS